MSGTGVRFLHAGELRLGAPLFGIGGLPYPLRAIMANARYRATERLVTAAIDAKVDFVLLAGGVISQSAAGTRPFWFFAEQCGRLAAHRIPVYWFESAGTVDQWSDFVPLPPNVFRGDVAAGQAFDFQRNGQTVAQLVAGSCVCHSPAADVPRIAALPEGLDGLPLAPVGVDFWAIGGSRAACLAPDVSGVAHCPGTTQGHSPDEDGPHGGVLVTIDRRRQCSTEFVATDSVRWHHERVRVVGDVDWAHLRRDLADRQELLIDQNHCDLLVVRWTLSGHGALWQQLRRDEVCRQLQSRLVKQGRGRQPAVWSLSIDLNPDAEQLAAWSAEENLFGEAARGLRRGPVQLQPHFGRSRPTKTPQPVALHSGN